eukprot:2768538-Amphidinium_carterae.1
MPTSSKIALECRPYLTANLELHEMALPQQSSYTQPALAWRREAILRSCISHNGGRLGAEE